MDQALQDAERLLALVEEVEEYLHYQDKDGSWRGEARSLIAHVLLHINGGKRIREAVAAAKSSDARRFALGEAARKGTP